MNKRDKLALLNILDTIEEMDAHCRRERCGTVKQFLDNTILKRAIAMCIISLSEMTMGFSEDFRFNHPHIDTSQFRALRNLAAHNFGAINFSKLWDAYSIDIPHLRRQLQRALDDDL